MLIMQVFVTTCSLFDLAAHLPKLPLPISVMVVMKHVRLVFGVMHIIPILETGTHTSSSVTLCDCDHEVVNC